MKVNIRVTTFQDRRTDELRRYADRIEEGRWRARVWLNEKKRTVESRRSLSLVGRLGAMGSDRPGDSGAAAANGFSGIRQACDAPFTIVSVRSL